MIVNITIKNIEEDLLDQVMYELDDLGSSIKQDSDFDGESFNMVLKVHTTETGEEWCTTEYIEKFFEGLNELSPDTMVDLEFEDDRRAWG